MRLPSEKLPAAARELIHQITSDSTGCYVFLFRAALKPRPRGPRIKRHGIHGLTILFSVIVGTGRHCPPPSQVQTRGGARPDCGVAEVEGRKPARVETKASSVN